MSRGRSSARRQSPWRDSRVAPLIIRPTLSHQRQDEAKKEKKTSLDTWYQTGTTKKAAKKFRKGACTNCGAMTHQKKDCVEVGGFVVPLEGLSWPWAAALTHTLSPLNTCPKQRPRKLGAAHTGKNIRPDEYLPGELDLEFDAKRDRWNGYDPAQYKRVVREYEKIEKEKQRIKSEKLKEEMEEAAKRKAEGTEAEEPDHKEAAEDTSSDEDSGEEDEVKGYAEKADQPGSKLDTKRRITVRNLRIREVCRLCHLQRRHGKSNSPTRWETVCAIYL